MAAAGTDDVEKGETVNMGRVRIVVMGGQDVGKSALISQFVSKETQRNKCEFAKDYYREIYEDNGTEICLEILDTDGTQCYPGIRKLAISSGDAFILVYGVDDEESFRELDYYRDMILESRDGHEKPIIVVANKADKTVLREVPKRTEAELIISKQWNHTFMVASARDETSVKDVFRELVRQAKVVYKDRFPDQGTRRMTTPAALFNRLRRGYKLRKQKSENKIRC